MILLLPALATWLALIPVAIANGVFREAVLTPALGELPARWVSTLMLCAAVFGAACLMLRLLRRPPTRSELLAVGLLWAALTVAFEFGFGHYVMGQPWERLAADYDILQGRPWPLVLVADLFAPLVAGMVCRR